MARRLVADYPDRVLRGTDWPHPNHAGPVPDDGLLMDLLAGIAPTPAARQALLVDNPQRLHGFTGPEAPALLAAWHREPPAQSLRPYAASLRSSQ